MKLVYQTSGFFRTVKTTLLSYKLINNEYILLSGKSTWVMFMVFAKKYSWTANLNFEFCNFFYSKFARLIFVLIVIKFYKLRFGFWTLVFGMAKISDVNFYINKKISLICVASRWLLKLGKNIGYWEIPDVKSRSTKEYFNRQFQNIDFAA